MIVIIKNALGCEINKIFCKDWNDFEEQTKNCVFYDNDTCEVIGD